MLTRSPTPTVVEPSEPACPFPVVGVGASAGGLEAVSQLFAGASGEEDIAFVLVQHLDPNHESLMAELIGRRTSLKVRQAADGDEVEPGCVLVIPPGHGLELEGSKLKLTEFERPRGLRRPIDVFFASLASQQGDRAACVILSGTGADGAIGLRAVKECGGVAFAQDPATASYDGMPMAAIGTGLVDFIEKPQGMLSALKTYFATSRDAQAVKDRDTVLNNLDDLCLAVKDGTGHDFSGYKPSTLERRITRRMQVLGLTSANAYLERLRDGTDECERLFRDLLINVTSFFRDKKYFDVLFERAIEPLIRSSTASDEIRVWVAGCSSGEEAYTIAILFAEAMRAADVRPFVQIFATDIDDAMLGIAREGRYPTSAMADLPTDIRDRYVIALEREFQIVPRVRDMIRFSAHSIIKDPPFTRLNLISCRNLLIYLEDQVQQSLVPLMHYCLKEGGFLFLGPSESLSSRDDLFAPIDQKARLFRRKDKPSSYPLELPSRLSKKNITRRQRKVERGEDVSEMPSADDQYARTLLDRYAPTSVRVMADGDMASSYGDLSRYFALRPGDGTPNALNLARPGLREAIGPLLREAVDKRERRAREGIEIVSDLGRQKVDLVADPLTDGSVAIIFIEKARFDAELRAAYMEPVPEDDRLAEAEEALRHTRTRLRGTVEELETANEELKSSNEEMMSMNEELQSANEELSTVNQELKTKVDELAVANDDLGNFLRSTRLAVVVVDRHGRLRMFTEPACQVFPLQPGDRGRSLANITPLVDDSEMEESVAACLESGRSAERVVERRDGAGTFLMRILPYRDAHGEIDGVTLTFADITEIKRLERRLREERERLSLALKAGGMGVWEYYEANDSVTPDATLRHFFSLDPHQGNHLAEYLDRTHQDDRDKVRAAIDRSVIGDTPFDIEFRVIRRGGGYRWLRAVGRIGEDTEGRRRLFGLTYDVTFQEEAKAEQALLLREMDHRVKNIFAVVGSIVTLSARDADEVGTFAEAVSHRIAGLARAHDLTSGRGRSSPVGIEALFRAVLAPYLPSDQITLGGPAIEIPADNVTPMGLVLHELATNAVKYGALATDTGRVALRWTNDASDPDAVTLTWTESRVEDISAPSERDGFGSRLIESSALQLSGTVAREWRDDGLEVRFSFRTD